MEILQQSKVAANLGVFAMPPADTDTREAVVSFTIASSDAPLTKTFTLGDDGKPRMSRGAGLSAGSARRATLSGTPDDMAGQLAGLLSSLSANEALIPAAPPAGRDVWPMTMKATAAGRSDVIARTGEYFSHVPGAPALLALDLDTKGYPPDIMTRLKSEGELVAVMATIFPPIKHAACVMRASVSSFIRRKNQPEDNGRNNGQHRYLFAMDGADAADFVRRLCDRLMLRRQMPCRRLGERRSRHDAAVLAVEPLAPLAGLERAEVGAVASAWLEWREAPKHILAHDVLAVLQQRHRCAAVRVDILDGLVLPALALLPFRPRRADELEMQLERSHFLAGHLPSVEIAHAGRLARPGRPAATLCRLRSAAQMLRSRPGARRH